MTSVVNLAETPALDPPPAPEASGLALRETGQGSMAVSVGRVDIATYVYRPTFPLVEARKPYLHPMRTTSGALVSTFRPWDHRWHKGLQMTSSHLGGRNFWGGKTFRLGEGYQWLDNVGQMEHAAFTGIHVDDGEVRLDETLTWLTEAGRAMLTEGRTLRFFGLDQSSGRWALDFSTSVRNDTDQPLEWGSPTTHGRPAAGYTGLFWRGPRSWTGGEIIASGGQGGEEMMGRRADWLAITGRHDEIEGGATVLFFAGTSSATVPIHWFVRSQPFAAINPSPAFHEAFTIEPGDAVALTHRAVVVDRMLGREELESLSTELAP